MKDKTIFGNNKLLQHLDQISDYKNVGITSPITMEIDMINACNNKCPGCTGGRKPLNAKLGLEEVTDWLTQMKHYGVKAITFTGGGEPLLNPSTLGAVEYARNVGLDVGFITNGGLLTKGKAEIIVKNSVWVRVSLDAGTPEMYKLTHGMNGDEFSKVVNNIGLLVQAKKDLKSDCTVGVGYLTDKRTIPGMIKATELMQGIGVDYLQFRPFHETTDNINKELSECKTYETPTFKVLASTQKYDKYDENFDSFRPYNFCHGANFVGVIQATGDLTICCHTRGIPKFNYGNLKKDSFENIWESEKKKKLLNNLDLNTCGPQYCRADDINRTLNDIMTDKEHVNFL